MRPKVVCLAKETRKKNEILRYHTPRERKKTLRRPICVFVDFLSFRFAHNKVRFSIGNVILSSKVKNKLSYDVASESEITPCNKINKPLVVYRFTGNVMTSITTLRT